MLANLLFGLIVKNGNLTVIEAGGRSATHGDKCGPAVVVRLHDRRVELRIFLRPKLAIGEAFMDERLTIEQGSLYDFLEICTRSVTLLERHPFWSKIEWLAAHLRRSLTFNPIGRAQKNVAHHYDLTSELYDLYLDHDKQYSCAYFDHSGQPLEEAQEDKKRHLAAKLLLGTPGLKVLDIGSGWGGLGLYLAQVCGAEVTGLTLSREQHRLSNQRAEASGLAASARFLLQDYRLNEGSYDRIVSVGMFEHVGPRHYREFFRKVKSLMNPGGVMVLHSIGASKPADSTNPWVTKYIFPGSYIPSLSEVIPAIEKEGFAITDIEILHHHYAETLRNWRERFYTNRHKVRALFDDRFCRMWDFYLTVCELGFRSNGLMVFQIQLAKNPGSVPWRRDYITDWEGNPTAKHSQAAE
jgi:cyclopropane-fatty-acyl-phospholipid synthase